MNWCQYFDGELTAKMSTQNKTTTLRIIKQAQEMLIKPIVIIRFKLNNVRKCDSIKCDDYLVKCDGIKMMQINGARERKSAGLMVFYVMTHTECVFVKKENRIECFFLNATYQSCVHFESDFLNEFQAIVCNWNKVNKSASCDT